MIIYYPDVLKIMKKVKTIFKNSRYKRTSMFYQPYGMEPTKYEESIYYDLANSLNFNNNDNDNNLFLSMIVNFLLIYLN